MDNNLPMLTFISAWAAKLHHPTKLGMTSPRPQVAGLNDKEEKYFKWIPACAGMTKTGKKIECFLGRRLINNKFAAFF
jgi:hypothetical protein